MALRVVVARVLIYLLSYLLAVALGHGVVREVVLRRHRLPEAGGLRRGGAVIGVLERALTLTFVLLGQYTAVALIVNAKSIARFPELKDRQFAEYYLVGTLSSMLFATLVGVVASWVLTLL